MSARIRTWWAWYPVRIHRTVEPSPRSWEHTLLYGAPHTIERTGRWAYRRLVQRVYNYRYGAIHFEL